MKRYLFALAILSILSSCDPGGKKPSAATITLVGTWVLDSSYVRDTVYGIPSYTDSIQNPSTAPSVTFSSNGIITSIDPAYTKNGISYLTDTIMEDYYVSSDTIYSRIVGCGCNYVPSATYTISDNQLIQTLKKSFNPNLILDLEVTYDTRK